jgi:hypothetical protein
MEPVGCRCHPPARQHFLGRLRGAGDSNNRGCTTSYACLHLCNDITHCITPDHQVWSPRSTLAAQDSSASNVMLLPRSWPTSFEPLGTFLTGEAPDGLGSAFSSAESFTCNANLSLVAGPTMDPLLFASLQFAVSIRAGSLVPASSASTAARRSLALSIGNYTVDNIVSRKTRIHPTSGDQLQTCQALAST